MDLTKTYFAGVFNLSQKQPGTCFMIRTEGYYSTTIVQARVMVKSGRRKRGLSVPSVQLFKKTLGPLSGSLVETPFLGSLNCRLLNN